MGLGSLMTLQKPCLHLTDKQKNYRTVKIERIDTITITPYYDTAQRLPC